jgi:hypothetical protein
VASSRIVSAALDIGRPFRFPYIAGNTLYLPRHFVVESKVQTGGWYAQRSPERIEGKAQASRT